MNTKRRAEARDRRDVAEVERERVVDDRDRDGRHRRPRPDRAPRHALVRDRPVDQAEDPEQHEEARRERADEDEAAELVEPEGQVVLARDQEALRGRHDHRRRHEQQHHDQHREREALLLEPRAALQGRCGRRRCRAPPRTKSRTRCPSRARRSRAGSSTARSREQARERRAGGVGEQPPEVVSTLCSRWPLPSTRPAMKSASSASGRIESSRL